MMPRIRLPLLLVLLLAACTLPPAPQIRGDPPRARLVVEQGADRPVPLLLPAGLSASEARRVAAELARGVPGLRPRLDPVDIPPSRGAWLVLHPLAAGEEGPDPACGVPHPRPMAAALLLALCVDGEEVAAVRVAGADERALWRAARLLLPDPRANPRPLRLLPHVEVGISGSFGF